MNEDACSIAESAVGNELVRTRRIHDASNLTHPPKILANVFSETVYAIPPAWLSQVPPSSLPMWSVHDVRDSVASNGPPKPKHTLTC